MALTREDIEKRYDQIDPGTGIWKSGMISLLCDIAGIPAEPTAKEKTRGEVAAEGLIVLRSNCYLVVNSESGELCIYCPTADEMTMKIFHRAIAARIDAELAAHHESTVRKVIEFLRTRGWVAAADGLIEFK